MSYLFDELETEEQATTAIRDRILLLGLQHAGKKAITDVAFFDKEPESIEDALSTLNYAHQQFINEENQSISLDVSDGQDSSWTEGLSYFRRLIFSQVKLLLWVVDITREDLFEESKHHFRFIIEQFKKENPKGHIVVLCHKVDRVPPEELVPLLKRVKKEFKEREYTIRFEATSIYYKESLRELIQQLMKDARINAKRFELITSIGQKLLESEKFRKFVVEHRDDPRAKPLIDFLNLEPQRTLPAFAEKNIGIDLTEYKIIEIVLVDKKTFSPITGISSREVGNSEQTIDYLIALQEFKDAMKNKPTDDDETTISIVSSSTGKVHGMIVDLVTKFLLITSFQPITLEKTQIFYEIIRKFAKSLKAEPKTAPPPSQAQTTAVPPATAVVPSKKPDKIKTDDKSSGIQLQQQQQQQQPIVPPTKTSISDEAKVVDQKKSSQSSAEAQRKAEESSPLEKPTTHSRTEEKMAIRIEEQPLEEKSIFSFLNKLRSEELIEEGSFPEEQDADIEAPITQAPKIQKEQLIVEPVEDARERLPKISDEKPPVVEEAKPLEKEPPAVAAATTAAAAAPDDDTSKSAKKEQKEKKKDTPSPPQKPKSRFLQRLREEKQRYLIRQVEIQKTAAEKAEDKLEMNEKEVKEMAEFLLKAQTTSKEK